VRKRFPIVLAANAKWPDAAAGGIGFYFNWVKVDNKGAGPVDISLAPAMTQGDLVNNYATITAGKVRVFNLAGPRRGTPDDQDVDKGEDWADQVYLVVGATGTTVLLEVADHPLVDLSNVT
jgi:hypothetical protein